MLTFEGLTEARRLLQVFCLAHVPSLMSQQSGISFKLHPDEEDIPPTGRVRHLTTTATCLSSLLDCPTENAEGSNSETYKLCSTFAKRALRRKEWKSEGSAGIYCRCRALPLVIRFSSEINSAIEEHVGAIFSQLDKHPERFGIGEADPIQREPDWYPPNAFHTYWSLEILSYLEADFPKDYRRLSARRKFNLRSRREGLLLWASQELGRQVALHTASPQSSMLDTDQLGWSLAIFLKYDERFHTDLERQDFIKQALMSLFSTQIPGVGTWRYYKPLFHYAEAGNAHCYVFETFAVLLQAALQNKPQAEVFRQLLKPYCENLISLWRYANSTKIPIDSGKETYGWTSGHRTNISSPDSWATASVFSYAQALRRLIGIWSREEALNSLNTRRSLRSPSEASAELASRGMTWGKNKTSVSEQLQTLFINPALMHVCMDRLEPDSKPIQGNQARSAILFGPPGTSKTTLIRALADIVGWTYVEIHASHFVKQGLSQVQKTADEIFKQLSELDHAVVLFDEIDELVRERDMEKDAFGRFLTTSMLPKLAELWEAKKILYFVATNHINYFDSAIIRSHRFDALILVSPPSFNAKISQLQNLLSSEYQLQGRDFETRESDIQLTLDKLGKLVEGSDSKDLEELREQQLDSKYILAKFALLRWDELEELASRLASSLNARKPVPRKISTAILEESLARISDSEWRKNKSYFDYIRDTRSERRDYQMLNAWEVVGKLPTESSAFLDANEKTWLTRAVDSSKEVQIDGYRLRFADPGKVSVRPIEKLPR